MQTSQQRRPRTTYPSTAERRPVVVVVDFRTRRPISMPYTSTIVAAAA